MISKRMYFITKIMEYSFKNHSHVTQSDLHFGVTGMEEREDSHTFSPHVSVSYLSSGLFIAMIVSLLFLVLLRFTAGVLFWIFIFGVIGIIGYGRYNLLVSEAIA